MEPTTVATALATVLATKAWEKIGENLGDAVTQWVEKFWSLLKHESPDTASAIELAPEQPLDYGQAMLEVQSVAARNDEFKQILIQLLAAAQADPNPRLAEYIQAEMNKLQSQQPSIQNLNWSKLQEKGVINQGNIENQTNNF
ncbi:conserved hypothetical protein [Planktothrix sp. PCC 11201]|uniref:hypothetical protein n=1 Tax=Planktothrix sp. PCC 11201 TaxID=1729650 RepID=UPI000917C92F|nr:hypothetical protein [Planktothrix sp. PCC 11201]SKB13688.1 conserved hypothetical protein [Planktothrix sp. PCC 11201]